MTAQLTQKFWESAFTRRLDLDLMLGMLSMRSASTGAWLRTVETASWMIAARP